MKKILAVIGLISILFIFAPGCGLKSQPQSIDELYKLREKRIEAATHKFNNCQKRDVEEAIISVFKLLDNSDVEFDIRPNKLLISRFWTYYAVFDVGFGKDFWEFIIKEKDGGVEVKSAFEAESNTGPFASPVSTKFKENIGIGGNPDVGATIADYDLLYSRIEYFLYPDKPWPSCESVSTKHGISTRRMVLCGRIGIRDEEPKNNQTRTRTQTGRRPSGR